MDTFNRCTMCGSIFNEIGAEQEIVNGDRFYRCTFCNELTREESEKLKYAVSFKDFCSRLLRILIPNRRNL
jgi:hypothetical protein